MSLVNQMEQFASRYDYKQNWEANVKTQDSSEDENSGQPQFKQMLMQTAEAIAGPSEPAPSEPAPSEAGPLCTVGATLYWCQLV